MRCIVPSCSSVQQRGKKTRFYSIPKNEKRRRDWFNVIFNDNSDLCDFDSLDFKKGKQILEYRLVYECFLV